MLTRRLRGMEWIWGVASNVASATAVGAATWWLTRRRAQRNAVDWKLEFIRGEEWTLRRLSDSTALDVSMYMTNGYGEPGFDPVGWSPDPGMDRTGIERADMKTGDSHRIVNSPHGISLSLTWIQSDTRLKAYIQTRVGKDEYTVALREALRDA